MGHTADETASGVASQKRILVVVTGNNTTKLTQFLKDALAMRQKTEVTGGFQGNPVLEPDVTVEFKERKSEFEVSPELQASIQQAKDGEVVSLEEAKASLHQGDLRPEDDGA